jgi:potassium channel LctB
MKMKNFTPIDEFVDQIAQKKVNSWFDKLSFAAILVVWITLVFFFGLAYYFLSSGNTYLHYNPAQGAVQGIFNHVYFSFITATTTGFGDIIPMGYFKVIAIVEVIFGFLLLAVVTSKFVSIKQNIILGEIYELSFHERVNRLRSSLLVFRQNISRIISKVEEKEIHKREISDLYTYISSFEDILREVYGIVVKPENSEYTKTLDPLNTELVFNSVINSFEKINELISLLDQNKKEWRRDVTIHLIYKCINLNQQLFDKANSEKMLSEKNLNDLNAQKSKIIDALRNAMNVAAEEKDPETIIVNN